MSLRAKSGKTLCGAGLLVLFFSTTALAGWPWQKKHFQPPLTTYTNPRIKAHEIRRPTYPYYYGRGFMAYPHYQMWYYPPTARKRDRKQAEQMHRRQNCCPQWESQSGVEIQPGSVETHYNE